MSTLSKTVEFLEKNKGNERKYTSIEIARELVRSHPVWASEKRKSSQGKGRDNIEKMLQAEIGSSKPGLHAYGVRWTKETPTHYYFAGTDAPFCMDPNRLRKSDPARGFIDRQSVRSKSRTRSKAVKLDEKALYNPLQIWLRSRNIYAMRIDETRANSSFPKQNIWRFPDLVGLEPLSHDWADKTNQFANMMGVGTLRLQLCSFEVKSRIGRSDARNCYMQAVTNSSWAHRGYLVTQDYDKEALKAIKQLNEAHGIGLIKLNVGNPPTGEIVIAARPRKDLDWNVVDQLYKHSPDYQRFIDGTIGFLANNRVNFPSDK